MPRKINVKKINLTIDDVRFVDQAVIINWSSDIGWGEYVIYTKDKKIFCDSECMDSNNDKAFLRELLKKLSEYIVENSEIFG